jgi:sialate O-acetylesterase
MPRHPFLAALVFAVSLCVFLPTQSKAEVKLPPVLSSHMVLQRDMPVPIWGTATAGEKVTVSFRGQEKSAAADPQGKWLVQLDPLKAGGPDVMKIAGANTVTLEDVLVGEVWVGSGQSNMAGGVAGYAKNDEVLAELAAANYPTLRLKRSGAQGWQAATADNNLRFSAILFAFGARLHQELDVPVGLMVGAVGGTPSGYWLSQEAYQSDAACQEAVRKAAANYSNTDAERNYRRDLERWEQAVEKAKQTGAKTPRKPDLPLEPGECRGQVGHLYEAHIRPYIPFGIRGVLWDQGESGTAISGVDQYTLMGALIRGWREEWSQGDFPFIYVQKPSGGGCAWDQADPVTAQAEKFSPLPAVVPGTADGLYVENHIRIMQYPRTGMATASDLGPGVHPVNKSGYGARAARVALGMVYGCNVEIYGPIYESHTIEGGQVRLRFTHVGQGLACRHGEGLQGFAVAGEDKMFHWADAVIDGDTVLVSCDKVANPVAVRYAWGRVHPWANLFNKDGLPALPFRTDSW